MATSHREANRTKWIGVRPAHEGDQIVAFDTASNAVKILYTVPASKILLVFGWYFTVGMSAAGTGSIRWSNAAAVLQYNFARLSGLVAVTLHGSQELYMPIEIPAAHTIEIYSGSATCSVYGGFHGILIPA